VSPTRFHFFSGSVVFRLPSGVSMSSTTPLLSPFPGILDDWDASVVHLDADCIELRGIDRPDGACSVCFDCADGSSVVPKAANVEPVPAVHGL
jgi:hypothetical protein